MYSKSYRLKKKKVLLCVHILLVKDSSSRGVHSLNNQVIQNHLLFRSLNDVFFYAILGYKAIHTDLGKKIHQLLF